jgi:iron complex outermembrane receptor protein
MRSQQSCARLAWACGVSAFAVLAGSQASAQSAPATGGAQQVEEVVVTGSRIRGVAPVGSSLVSLGRDEVLSSGAATTADLLKQVPQITALGFNAEGSLGAAAASNITRATGPNLRGIGPTATLTILDGHRVSSAGTQGQVTDPSFLPPLALERVEVIADGASAIYGSDAVAGVINLIPRKTFTGFEFTARAGVADGYNEQQVGGVAGFDWTGGHLTVAVDHLRNDELKASDRWFISDDRRPFGGANGLATNCASPGRA